MILAAAQTIPHQADIEQNIQDHYRLTTLAADNGAQLIVFPEMSLTGYQREAAEANLFIPNDLRLQSLRNLAEERDIIIIAGAPIKVNAQLCIGSFVLHPDKSLSIYTKQFLHDGEEYYFVACEAYNPQIQLSNKRISLSICADITHPEHPQQAAKRNSTVYIASIFYTPNGISEAYQDLATYAKQYSLNILMANFGAPSYGFESAGQSAFWNNEGNLITSLPSAGEALLIVSKTKSGWLGKAIETNKKTTLYN